MGTKSRRKKLVKFCNFTELSLLLLPQLFTINQMHNIYIECPCQCIHPHFKITFTFLKYVFLEIIAEILK